MPYRVAPEIPRRTHVLRLRRYPLAFRILACALAAALVVIAPFVHERVSIGCVRAEEGAQPACALTVARLRGRERRAVVPAGNAVEAEGFMLATGAVVEGDLRVNLVDGRIRYYDIGRRGDAVEKAWRAFLTHDDALRLSLPIADNLTTLVLPMIGAAALILVLLYLFDARARLFVDLDAATLHVATRDGLGRLIERSYALGTIEEVRVEPLDARGLSTLAIVVGGQPRRLFGCESAAVLQARGRLRALLAEHRRS